MISTRKELYILTVIIVIFVGFCMYCIFNETLPQNSYITANNEPVYVPTCQEDCGGAAGGGRNYNLETQDTISFVNFLIYKRLLILECKQAGGKYTPYRNAEVVFSEDDVKNIFKQNSTTTEIPESCTKNGIIYSVVDNKWISKGVDKSL